MAAKRNQHRPTSGLRVRGFYRVHIVEQGDRIVGDSGWCENKVVNQGVLRYLITPLGAGTDNHLAFMALGTGTVPDVTGTALPGEITDGGSRSRVAVASATQGSTRVDFAGTWLSSNSVVTTTRAIANIMIISSTTSGGTIFAGNTFQVSTLNLNQDEIQLDGLVDVPLAA